MKLVNLSFLILGLDLLFIKSYAMLMIFTKKKKNDIFRYLNEIDNYNCDIHDNSIKTNPKSYTKEGQCKRFSFEKINLCQKPLKMKI